MGCLRWVVGEMCGLLCFLVFCGDEVVKTLNSSPPLHSVFPAVTVRVNQPIDLCKPETILSSMHLQSYPVVVQ